MSNAIERLDLGELKLSEGFFLVRDPKVKLAPFQPHNVATDRYRHVFTYRKSPQTIKDAAIEVIDSAREKVFLASFLLGDTDLLDALYRAADRLRGGVYVVSALDQESLRRGLAELGRFFARLWASCVFEMPPGKAHSVQPRRATDSPCTVPVPPVGPGNSLIWTYPAEHLILDTLHDVIRWAEHTLLLATFGRDRR